MTKVCFEMNAMECVDVFLEPLERIVKNLWISMPGKLYLQPSVVTINRVNHNCFPNYYEASAFDTCPHDTAAMTSQFEMDYFWNNVECNLLYL